MELKLEVLKRFKSVGKGFCIGRNLSLATTTIKTICNRNADQIRELSKAGTWLQSKKITKIRC